MLHRLFRSTECLGHSLHMIEWWCLWRMQNKMHGQKFYCSKRHALGKVILWMSYVQGMERGAYVDLKTRAPEPWQWAHQTHPPPLGSSDGGGMASGEAAHNHAICKLKSKSWALARVVSHRIDPIYLWVIFSSVGSVLTVWRFVWYRLDISLSVWRCGVVRINLLYVWLLVVLPTLELFLYYINQATLDIIGTYWQEAFSISKTCFGQCWPLTSLHLSSWLTLFCCFVADKF
jgi:hypothetical protein